MNCGRVLTLIGLCLNIIGVILLFFVWTPYKDFPIGAQSGRKDTGYLMILNKNILFPGLALVIAGNALQIFGILL